MENELTGLQLSFRVILWIVGVIVSLAVGFGMVNGTLSIWFIPSIIIKIVGWLVVISTIIGLFLGILNKFH